MQNRDAQRLHELTDERLAELLREDAEVFAVLLTRYRGVVAFFAGQYTGRSLEADDLVQEGLLGLYSAALSFSPERGVQFRTYASACIQNRIRNAARAEKRKIVPLLSFDDPDTELSDSVSADEPDPEQEVLAKEWAVELDALMDHTLSRQEREIFCCALSGMSYEEIAEHIHSPQKSVDNAIQRARRKLRAALKEFRSAT